MLELYLVSDRSWLNDRPLEEDIEQAILGGVTMVQLREKNLTDEEFTIQAKKVKTICSKYHIPFIINDNVAVALAVDSDGIHIGQDDQPVKRVRKIIGPHKIIGVSAHNLKEALAAKEDGADYLGVGAMFNTSTKDDATAVSFTQLHEITTKIGLPVVAIGGINQDNCLLLKGTKIDGIAVVLAIMSAPDIKEAAAKLKAHARGIYD